MQYGMKWHDMVIIIKIFGTTFAFFFLVGIFGGIFHLRLWCCSYGLWIVFLWIGRILTMDKKKVIKLKQSTLMKCYNFQKGSPESPLFPSWKMILSMILRQFLMNKCETTHKWLFPIGMGTRLLCNACVCVRKVLNNSVIQKQNMKG